jgi:twinkle protein
MNEIYTFNPDDAKRFAIEQHARTKLNGNELLFQLCPYCHGGENRDKYTFSINLQNGAHNCKRSSCGKTGNMITLHKEFGFSLGRNTDTYLDRERRHRPYKRREIAPDDPAQAAAIDYFRTRGISEKTVRRYEVTTKADDHNVLVFQFFSEDGTPWLVKYRRTDFDKTKHTSKEWCEKDRKPLLFGMNQCSFDGDPLRLVMTEGQIDSMSLAEAGIENAVSVPFGKNGFTWVPYCWDFLRRFDELVIFGDNENGEITLLDYMRNTFKGKVLVVRQEDYLGCKDANEILVKHGAQALRDAVDNAEALPVRHTKDITEIQRRSLSEIPHMETGIQELDNVLGGLFMGQVVILTGPRGDGKSTFASQHAVMAVEAGYKVFFYSAELPDWQFRAWLDLQVAGDEFIDEAGRIDEEAMTKIEKWYKGKITVYDNTFDDEQTETEEQAVIGAVMNCIKQQGTNVVFLDNLMTVVDSTSSENDNTQQTRFVKNVARIAKRYNVMIVLVAHPRKSSGPRTFDMDDISGSANITNLADVVMRYSRPTKKDGENQDPKVKRLLTVQKNRNTGRLQTAGIALGYSETSKRVFSVQHDAAKYRKLGWLEMEEDYDTIPF